MLILRTNINHQSIIESKYQSLINWFLKHNQLIVNNRSKIVLKRLKLHETVHTGELPHKCDHCDKRFRLSSALNSHIVKEHPYLPNLPKVRSKRNPKEPRPLKGKIVECDICGIKLTKWCLVRHKKLHDSDSLKHKCSMCDRGFNRKDSLRVIIMHVDGGYVQTLIDVLLLFTYTQEHESTHTGDQPFKCITCDVRFDTLEKFKFHQLALHPHLEAS